MSGEDWVPEFIEYGPSKGWTGQERVVQEPVLGWTSVIEKAVRSEDQTRVDGVLSALIAGGVLDFAGAYSSASAETIGLVYDYAVVLDKTMATLPARSTDLTAALASIGLAGRATALSEMRGALTTSLYGRANEAARAQAAVQAAFLGYAPEFSGARGSAGFTPVAEVTYVVSATQSWAIPGWSNFVDAVYLSGGASGQTGSGAINTAGKGGQAGQWGAATIQRGSVSLPWDASSLSVVIGSGGSRPASSDFQAPNPGGRTSVSYTVGGTVYFGYGIDGGSGTVSSGQNGAAPGNFSFNGKTYNGGTGGTGNAGAGTVPGGAGAGGNGGIFGSRTQGGAGAAGRVWLRFYQ